jgi:hypothetical protein
VKNENPNLVIAGMAPVAKTITKPIRIATITKAKIMVTLENILSLKPERRLNRQLFIGPGGSIFSGISFVTKFSFHSFPEICR